MSDTVVEVKGLQKTFRVGFRRKRVEAVRDVSFRVERGEIVGLIGPNGAGKTTSLKILMGLVNADAGTARLFGEMSTNVSSRDRVGYLPESPYFYEHLKVTELLGFYGGLFDIPKAELAKRIDKLIEMVGLEHATDRPIRKFSKGMRQRAGLAQALINDPELVILDEPQSGLDPTGRKEVRDLIARLRDEGKTLMFSSHILPDVEAVCDRVVVMSKGVVVEEGTLSELASEQVRSWEVLVRGSEVAADVLGEHLLSQQQRGELTLLRFAGDASIDEIVRRLLDGDVALVSVSPERVTLEQVYLRDTREAGR